MSEIKRDMYNSDDAYIEALEEQLRAMRDRFDVDEPIFTEHFIKESIIRPINSDGTIVNHYREDLYYYLDPLTPRAGENGESGRLSYGPIKRLADHGFIIKEFTSLNGAEPSSRDANDDRYHPSADSWICVKIEYVGDSHPILEIYQDNE